MSILDKSKINNFDLSREKEVNRILMFITTDNIDEKMDFYATVLTLLVEIKKRYENEDEDEDISDAESLIELDTD